MRLLIFYVFILTSIFANGQTTEFLIDSLRKEVNKYPDFDTLKIENIILLGGMMGKVDTDKEIELYKVAYHQAEKIKHPRLFSKSAHELGVAYYFLGKLEKADLYLNVALDVSRKNELNNLLEILLDLGQIEDILGKDELAVQHTIEATEIAETRKDHNLLVTAYNNLAGFYYYRNQNKKALAYYEKARDILIEYLPIEQHSNGLAITESNIGWCHYYMGNLDKAINQLKKAVDIHREFNNNTPSSCNTRNSLAEFYIDKNKYNLATLYANEALSIANEIQYSEGQATSYYRLGTISMEQNKFQQSINNLEKAFEQYKDLGNLHQMSEIYEDISKCYNALGQHEKAFEFMENSKIYSDSLTILESKASFEDAVTKYETEKKEAENALLQEQSKLKDAQLEQQRIETKAREEKQIIIGSGIALFLIAIIFFFINRNRLKSRKNKELAIQRDEIAEQKKEITDSINYAKRIQNSFLPSNKDFAIRFNDHFLMYEPKDIVAGDFYILEDVGEHLFFAVADCTGHGVPGAMVSIVCSHALRKVIYEDEETDPATILYKTRELVIHQFARKGHVVKDGMDITFCTYHKKDGKLFWAGANNPLWIIRKGEVELEEIKPDKQPIGRYLTNAPFTSHEVHIGAGDQIYLITDGYPDQFGGPKGKKFKYKRFKRLLIELKDKPMSEQLETLETAFTEWKGEMEQIDDVCVLGIRF